MPFASHSWKCLHTSSAALYAKKGRGKDAGQHKASPSPDADEGAEEAEFDTQPYEDLMSQSVAHFQHELGNIHTGRASPGLLEPIEVPGRGEHERSLPLRTYGTVTARSATLLVVSVYDASMLEPVAKAIRDSPLKLPARVEAKEVHVSVPRPTMEQIKGMLKLVAHEAEKSKTSVRGARQKAMDTLKKALKSRDDQRRASKEVQTLTDQYVEQIEQLKAAKDRELHDLR